MTTDTQNAPPPAPPKFCNPYDHEGVVVEEKRIHTEVSRDDYLLIKLIRPDQGTIKNVIGLLWKQLCYELRTRNITDTTSATEFESFLASCRIIPASEYEALVATGRLSNGTADNNSGRDTKTPGGHERGRTARVSARGSKQPKQQSDVSGERTGESGEQNK